MSQELREHQKFKNSNSERNTFPFTINHAYPNGFNSKNPNKNTKTPLIKVYMER